MRSPVLAFATLALASQLAVAEPPGPAGHRGPPIDSLAAELELTDAQKAEVQRIFEAAHERMETARKDSMAQVDMELAAVLTPVQLARFEELRQERSRHRRGPSPGREQASE